MSNRIEKKMKPQKVCMNPDCLDNIYLTTYNCPTHRPITHLADTCWNCHKSDFLKDLPKEEWI